MQTKTQIQGVFLMKKGLTELVFILDRSGSMHGLEADTIGGFNSLIERQRSEPGEALVSTVLFNDNTQVLHDRVRLDEVQPITEREYRVGGCTALLDAIGGAIHHIGNVHKYARGEDVPEHTLFVITTDGMENASRVYTAQKVRETAGRIGIFPDRAANYNCDSEGTRLNYEAMDAAVSAVRSSAPLDARWKDAIEEDFRKRGKK